MSTAIYWQRVLYVRSAGVKNVISWFGTGFYFSLRYIVIIYRWVWQMSWVKVAGIIPAVSSSFRLEETAEIHPQVKLHFFFVSLSGKQNNNNDNKKRNISFASWGFITWIFDSLIDNSEVLISCLLDTSFFLMSSDLETARFSWTKINYSFILYLFQGVFFRYHQAGFRSTVNFFAVMGLIFLADVSFTVNFSMYPAKKKINDLKLQKRIIFILFNKVLIQ